MKNLIAAIILVLPGWVYSQNLFLLEDETTTEKDRNVNVLIIKTTDDFDEAINNYKKFAKDEYDLKVKKENNNYYIIEEVDIPQFSVKRGDLKTYLYHTDTVNILAFSFLLGYDISINSQDYPQEMANFKKFVIGYMEYHYEQYYAERIKELNKSLDKSQKELSKMEKEVSSTKKKIESLEKKAEKETDEAKNRQIQSERTSLENETEQLLGELPGLRDNVSEYEKAVFELKTEMNAYLQAIAKLEAENN